LGLEDGSEIFSFLRGYNRTAIELRADFGFGFGFFGLGVIFKDFLFDKSLSADIDFEF
jgi:hypothetical protein